MGATKSRFNEAVEDEVRSIREAAGSTLRNKLNLLKTQGKKGSGESSAAYSISRRTGSARNSIAGTNAASVMSRLTKKTEAEKADQISAINRMKQFEKTRYSQPDVADIAAAVLDLKSTAENVEGDLTQ